ncbi:MAG TPA: cupredoxin domain-containing protein [Actinomycetota bacterium]
MSVAVLSLALVGAACAQEDDAGGEPGGQAPAGETITLDMKDFAFQPAVLEGEEGQTVTVAIHNEDDVAHTFTVESQGVDVEVEPGGSAEAEVTFGAQAAPFVCRFHQAGGMTGQLTVAGGAADPSPAADDTGSGFDPYG